jgi:diguanylate cyclase (GGDEF)-like protein
LLFIDVVGLKQINIAHGRDAGDEVLRYVVRHATAGLRVADILFRDDSDEFVALLNDTNADMGKVVAHRIRENIRTNALVSTSHRSILVDVSVTAVSAPDDGRSLPLLMAAAHRRASETSPEHGRPRVR